MGLETQIPVFPKKKKKFNRYSIPSQSFATLKRKEKVLAKNSIFPIYLFSTRLYFHAISNIKTEEFV